MCGNARTVAQSALRIVRMYLVQILLPLYDNEKNALDASLFAGVRAELTQEFGGITAYTRSPAVGLWKEDGEVTRDEIVIFEVMAETLNRSWWAAFRKSLAVRFRQEVVIARALPFEPL
jgi:hypothetical protein